MSIFSALGTSLSTGTGLIAGGVAAAGAIAVATVVIVSSGDSDNPPAIGEDPVQVSAPRIDAVATVTNSGTETIAETTTETTVTSGSEVVVKTPTETTAEAVEVTSTQLEPTNTAPIVEATTGGLVSGGGSSSNIKVGDGSDTKVAPDDTGSRVVASVEPANDVKPGTKSASKPQTSNVLGGVGLGAAIQIDLVRVDKRGEAVIAGKAPKGGQVEISVDGTVIAEVAADTKGAFVALFDIPQSEDAQVMTLALRDGQGDAIPSPDRIFIKGRSVVVPDPELAETATSVLPKDEVAPQVIVATDEGIKVVQPASFDPGAPEVMANVTIDLISYDTQGEVVLAGRGKVKNHVRIYVNDTPVKTKPIAPDGSWQLSLPEVDAGLYTLRVDEIDDQGKVVSRVETPFKKEEPAEVKKVASVEDPVVVEKTTKDPLAKKITIQPGATLWELAEARYGQGNLYMQIFEANRDNIRNPDLIYPGQIFTLPD